MHNLGHYPMKVHPSYFYESAFGNAAIINIDHISSVSFESVLGNPHSNLYSIQNIALKVRRYIHDEKFAKPRPLPSSLPPLLLQPQKKR